MKRLFRCPSGSWPVVVGYDTVEEEEESKSANGWVGLPSRLTGWIGVKVAVDMRCRGMLGTEGEAVVELQQYVYASKGVCRGASFTVGDLACRVLGYRKQASCGMQSEQS